MGRTAPRACATSSVAGERDLERVVAQRLAPGRARPRPRAANASGVAGAPRSAASARRARHGVWATPPSAMRHVAHRAVVDVDARGDATRRRTRTTRGRAPCGTPSAAPSAGGGSSTAVIRSPGSSTVSRVGLVAGQPVQARRAGPCARPSGPCTWTTASSAASATAMSDGWVATQCRRVAEDREVAVVALARRAARARARACCTAS